MDKLFNVEALIDSPGFREWVHTSDMADGDELAKIAKQFNVAISDVEHARLLLISLKQPKTDFKPKDEGILWDRIDNSINEVTNQKASIKISHIDSKRYYNSGKWWYGIAATLLLLVSFFIVLKHFSQPMEQEGSIVAMVEKSVPKGQKLRLFLPDGSKVTLNSSSRISYPDHFTESKREVNIEGEAFFEVKKDSLRPFIVKSKHAVTEVLGTTFNVCSYPDDENTTVSLLEGSVIVREHLETGESSLDHIVLEPGEEISLTDINKTLAKRKIRHPNELEWTNGVLAFNNETIGRVFKKLELWYGVSFVFNKELKSNEILTGRFQNEYLDNVLESINYTIRFDYEIEGDTVYVKL